MTTVLLQPAQAGVEPSPAPGTPAVRRSPRPLAPVREEAPRQPSASVVLNVPRSTILVVDDEEDILLSLQGLFRAALPNVDVVTAATADVAETLARERPIDLMLLDYRLPERTGLEVLKRVRQHKPNMLALVMTAFPQSGVVEEAVDWAHVKRIFAKPMNEDELLVTVADLLQMRPAPPKGAKK